MIIYLLALIAGFWSLGIQEAIYNLAYGLGFVDNTQIDFSDIAFQWTFLTFPVWGYIAVYFDRRLRPNNANQFSDRR